MADAPEIGSTAALAGAVVALAKIIEYLVQKFRSSQQEAPVLSKHGDRLTQLELKMAVLESRGPVNDSRFEEVLRRLERLDEKLDRTFASPVIKHRGEF